MLGITFSPLLRSAQAATDEETKKAFLKAREEMKTVPADEGAASKPKAKPKPRKTSPTPSPTPKPSPTPEETPRPKPKPTPEPTATPKKKKTPEPELSPTAERRAIKVPEEAAKTPVPMVTPKPTPSPTPPPRTLPAKSTEPAPVTIEKSGLEENTGLEPSPEPPPKRHWWQFGSVDTTQYKYITRTLRDAIDRAPVARHRWRYIVVHNSGTKQGNAKIFDYYHRHTRKMPNGLAYHFVIGNGSSSGNGQIEIGDRWRRQINGGHVHSDYLNNIALGICLVGDFNRSTPTKAQLDALDELIRYLRKRVGEIDRKP
ncbi:MAG: hypothetical protein QOD99_2178, partial [Chthoniobacter sp.]|nr:hypothetical protein [Chthoniobacter sp.]